MTKTLLVCALLLTQAVFAKGTSRKMSPEEIKPEARIISESYFPVYLRGTVVESVQRPEPRPKRDLEHLSDTEVQKGVVTSLARVVLSCGITANLLAASTVADSVPVASMISYMLGSFADCDRNIQMYSIGGGTFATSIVLGGILSIPGKTVYQWVEGNNSVENSMKASYITSRCLLKSIDPKTAESNASCGLKVKEYLAYSDELALRNPKAFETPKERKARALVEGASTQSPRTASAK